jgi:hypothetical protein
MINQDSLTHMRSQLRDKQNSPTLWTFLLEPSQSQPPQALRCQTQLGSWWSLGPGSRVHGGKRRHGKNLGREKRIPVTQLQCQCQARIPGLLTTAHLTMAVLHPQAPVQEMLGALLDKNGWQRHIGPGVVQVLSGSLGSKRRKVRVRGRNCQAAEFWLGYLEAATV